MKHSKNDKWLDRIISQVAASSKDKPIPDFDKWRKEHPKAVHNLKSRADDLQSTNIRARENVAGEPSLVRLPRLAWACRIAALLLVAVSFTACFILARENRILRLDLKLARQKIETNKQQQIVEVQNNQQQAISTLHQRLRKLEQHMVRGISPRMLYYPEAPYYSTEKPGDL